MTSSAQDNALISPRAGCIWAASGGTLNKHWYRHMCLLWVVAIALEVALDPTQVFTGADYRIEDYASCALQWDAGIAVGGGVSEIEGRAQA